MLMYAWRLLQCAYRKVRKHAYTERGQKCTKAYIKRYTTQVTKLAGQCSYMMVAWYMMSRDRVNMLPPIYMVALFDSHRRWHRLTPV